MAYTVYEEEFFHDAFADNSRDKSAENSLGLIPGMFAGSSGNSSYRANSLLWNKLGRKNK